MWFPYQPAKMMWSNVDLSTWWCRCVLPVELMAGGWSMVATGLLKGPIKCEWVMAREPDYKGTHRPERRPTLHINACVRCIHCKVRTAAINASKDLINLHIELVTSRVKVCVYIYIYIRTTTVGIVNWYSKSEIVHQFWYQTKHNTHYCRNHWILLFNKKYCVCVRWENTQSGDS